VQPLRRFPAAVVAGAFGIATAAILAGRIDRSFDYDESVSIASVIQRGSATVPLTETQVFNNHPLFAVGQSIWWAIGGEGEARQRTLPILYGAFAVALLAGWAARRWGVWSAVAAGSVVMLNPMFVTQGRAVRGYSLAVLGVVVSTLALIEYLRRRDRGVLDGVSVVLLAVHAGGAVVAVGTHAFAAVAFAAIGVGVLVGGRADRWLLTTWAVAVVATVLVYLPTVGDLLETAEERGSQYKPWFARLLAWEILGRDRLTAIVIGACAVGGVIVATFSLAVRRDDDGMRLIRGPLHPAPAIALGVAVATTWIVWQVLQPADLFPRFFMVLLPLVALAVARFVRFVPPTVAVVILALVFTVANVIDARDATLPLRDAAAFTDRAEAAGLTTCVVGSESLGAYRSPPQEFLVEPARYDEQFAACDVVLRIGSWGSVIAPAADEAYSHRGRIGPIDVWATVPLQDLGI
jgi:hypothetical protein